MSVNTIERILWELGEKPERVKAFVENPDGYLAKYPLSEKEIQMLRTMDVKALCDYGVSNMLTIMAGPLVSGNNPLLMFDYLYKLNNNQWVNNMQLPAWQFAGIRFALGVRNLWLGTLRLFGIKKGLI